MAGRSNNEPHGSDVTSPAEETLDFDNDTLRGKL